MAVTINLAPNIFLSTLFFVQNLSLGNMTLGITLTSVSQGTGKYWILIRLKWIIRVDIIVQQFMIHIVI